MALSTIKLLALGGAAFAAAPLAAVYVAPELFRGTEPPPVVKANLPEPLITLPKAPEVETEQLPVPSVNPQMTIIPPGVNGKFVLNTRIKGINVPMIFDKGASVVALTYEDGARIGIKTNPDDFSTKIETANGAIKGAEVMLPEVRVDSIVIRNVSAVVLPKGSMKSSLLGRTFWGRLGTGFSFNKGNLVLKD